MDQEISCEFKSAKELGLEQAEYEGLVRTLTLMEAGKIQHYQDRQQEFNINPLHQMGNSNLPIFSMTVWRETHLCGTVCCIGGTAEVLGGLGWGELSTKSKGLLENGNHALYRLFYDYPATASGGYGPTVAQSARALRGYLTTGRTDWITACQEP